MAKGGVGGRPDSFLARVLRKFRKEQEKIARKLKEIRTKKFYAPSHVVDQGRKGNYKNGVLTFTATDKFMKKHNLQKHVGRTIVRNKGYEYSVPYVRANDGHYHGLKKALERVLPPKFKPNPQKQTLERQEKELESKKQSAPRVSGLRPGM